MSTFAACYIVIPAAFAICASVLSFRRVKVKEPKYPTISDFFGGSKDFG